jgi:hypothetical protein
MRGLRIIPVVFVCLVIASCSPRDFLTRRLAADLVAGSETFKTPQQFFFRLGVVPNKDYISPEYLVLQRRGWITGTTAPCPPNISPPPCWDVALTPIGVETFRDLIPSGATSRQYFPITTARRELVGITGISRNANVADVDFTWKWVPSNEVGAALVAGGVTFKSTVGFKHFDDGWRLLDGTPKGYQGLVDALKDAEPAP